MAKSGYHATVGTRVYRHCRPLNAGFVTAMTTLSVPTAIGIIGYRAATVSWLDGSVTTERLSQLKDFDSLIDDHQRKLKTHKATAKKLIAMQKKAI